MRALRVNAGIARGGEIFVPGFKHSFVSVLAGAVAARGAVIFRNAPDIEETSVMTAILRDLGASVTARDGAIRFDCSTIRRSTVDASLAVRIHGSLYLVPSLLGALGAVAFRESGGCAIGDDPDGRRPTEHVERVLKRFGGRIKASEAGWLGRAQAFTAAEIDIMDFSESTTDLTGPEVSGATKTALIASLSVAQGDGCVIRNPYPKPDVTDLLDYARRAGFRTSYANDRIRVQPPPDGAVGQVPEMLLTPDLSVIMTFITLAVLSGREIALTSMNMAKAKDGLAAEIAYLDAMGVSLEWRADRLAVRAPRALRSVDIEVKSTGIYSDHQPFFALMLTRGDRPATIRERVWKSRFAYVDALRLFGARIERFENHVTVHPSALKPPNEPVKALDLRMAAVALVAACAVGGPAVLEGMDHLARGYEGLVGDFERLGAAIELLEKARED